MTLHAGIAEHIITPSLKKPVFLAGFGRNRRATAVHDDLTIRALALQSGRTAVVLAALDLIGFFRWHAQDVRKMLRKTCPDFDLILASTHTHHGPDTMGLYGPSAFTPGLDPEYLAWLKATIARTLVQAVDHLQPVSLKTCCLSVPGVAMNARDPEIVDEELTCIQFLDLEEDKILATVMNFPCHPEVLFDENTIITADYPHFLRKTVEAETNGFCLFFSGALGGMMTPDVEDHSFEEAEAMGQRLAAEGLACLQQAAPINNPMLEHKRQEFSTPLFSPLLRLAMITGVIKGGPTWKRQKITETNLIRIGPAWFVSVPGELLPKLGLRIKSLLRQAGAQCPGIIGLANDETGYILPEADYRYPLNPFKPGSHYEETMSLGPKIGLRLMTAIEKLIAQEEKRSNASAVEEKGD